MQKQTPIKLKGIIIAAAWKNNGDVLAVDIAGYDEKRYRVVDDHMGRRLRHLVKERLIIEGVIETTTPKITIHVKHFQFDNAVANPNEIQKET